MSDSAAASKFSEVQEPEVIIVAPTRELINQIYLEARKFAYGYKLVLNIWIILSFLSPSDAYETLGCYFASLLLPCFRCIVRINVRV